MNEKHVKYPRTYHLPYSPTMTADDKRLESDSHFSNFDEVVVTEKRDGENTTVYQSGFIHARSLDGNKHPWQAWLKSRVQQWCFDIPEGWRICGENLYPQHSIAYTFDTQDDFFQVFGVYNENNECIAWDDVVFICESLGLKPVPVIYRGKYDKDKIIAAYKEYCSKSQNEVEGFVVRNAKEFSYDEFSKNVGKYVREHHVQTDEHWTKSWVPNKIKNA